MDIVDRLRDPEQGLTSSDRFHLHKDAVAEIEQLRAINANLLAALQAMLATYGKPRREEWLNDAGFEHLKRVDAMARAALAQAQAGPNMQEIESDDEADR